MTVRGKFFVIGHERWPGQDGTKIKLSAVVAYASDKENIENRMFHKHTPSGTIEMYVNNPDAETFFTLGKSIYVDFTETPK